MFFEKYYLSLLKGLQSEKDPLPDLKHSLEELGWSGKVNVIRPFFLIIVENKIL